MRWYFQEAKSDEWVSGQLVRHALHRKRSAASKRRPTSRSVWTMLARSRGPAQRFAGKKTPMDNLGPRRAVKHFRPHPFVFGEGIS